MKFFTSYIFLFLNNYRPKLSWHVQSLFFEISSNTHWISTQNPGRKLAGARPLLVAVRMRVRTFGPI